MSQHLIIMSHRNVGGGTPPPAAPAQVLARTLYAWGLTSSNCAVTHNSSNGVCHQFADTGASDYNWLLSGVASDYDIKATKVSGIGTPSFSSGWSLNNYANLGTERRYWISQSVAGISDVVLDVSIRYAANGTLIMTAQHSLTAEAKK